MSFCSRSEGKSLSSMLQHLVIHRLDDVRHIPTYLINHPSTFCAQPFSNLYPELMYCQSMKWWGLLSSRTVVSLHFVQAAFLSQCSSAKPMLAIYAKKTGGWSLHRFCCSDFFPHHFTLQNAHGETICSWVPIIPIHCHLWNCDV